MSEGDSQKAKLRGLRQSVDALLRNPGTFYDPEIALEYFKAYNRAASELKAAFPDVLSDLPDRPIPRSRGASEFEGRGYIPRHFLERLIRDINYIFSVLNPDATRSGETVDVSKLTFRQILKSITPAQAWAVAGALILVVSLVATGGYKLGALVTRMVSKDGAQVGSPLSNDVPDVTAKAMPIRAGTIIATHYPTGELFAVDPIAGSLQLLSARLGEPSGLAIRGNGEIIVLDGEHGVILAVHPRTGHHRYVGAYRWGSPPRDLTLASDESALVAVDGAVITVDLDSGESAVVASGDLLKGASGIAQTHSDMILVTTLPDALVSVSRIDGSIAVVSKGGEIWYPRAPTIESTTKVLLGTAGTPAAVVRVDLETGGQEIVATGPFHTVAGLAIEADGSILVADNGRGAPGDGFLARIDPATRRVDILVSAQTSGWKFVNGRSVAVFARTIGLE